MKVAVVTPYAGEAPSLITRCLESVQAQTFPDAVHYFVCDGPGPRISIDAHSPVRQIHLPIRHGDYGNTPRCVGSLCAINEGADLITYLDVDNEYLPSHLAALVERLQSGAYDVIFARRRIRLPEYPDVSTADPGDELGHVDTNCLAISRQAAFLLPMWGLMPKSLAAIGDVVMRAVIRHFSLRCGSTVEPTVDYWSAHKSHYEAAGKRAPLGAKQIDTDQVLQQFDPLEVWKRMRLELRLGRVSAAPEP
jgi:glycosyltransferase involved in cell wall biosynthesis